MVMPRKRGGRLEAIWKADRMRRQLGELRCTLSEWSVATRLIREGWELHRRGWPDFLAVKDGKLRLIEVKAGKDKLTEEQKRVHELLRSAGLDVEVVR
jgi:hypothetical protein